MTETPSPEGEGVLWGNAGALPQTLQGTLPLDSARGNCPLTLFGLPGLVALPNALDEGGV